jgi:hypothetical protein
LRRRVRHRAIEHDQLAERARAATAEHIRQRASLADPQAGRRRIGADLRAQRRLIGVNRHAQRQSGGVVRGRIINEIRLRHRLAPYSH